MKTYEENLNKTLKEIRDYLEIDVYYNTIYHAFEKFGLDIKVYKTEAFIYMTLKALAVLNKNQIEMCKTTCDKAGAYFDLLHKISVLENKIDKISEALKKDNKNA